MLRTFCTYLSTYIGKPTENFRSTYTEYIAGAFSVHGYPELSTFSRDIEYEPFLTKSELLEIDVKFAPPRRFKVST